MDLLIRRLVPQSPDMVLAEDQEYNIVEVFVGKGKPGTLGGIEKKFSCAISGIIRCGHMSLPQKEDDVKYGDKIICTVRNENREELLQSLCREAVVWNQS